MREPTDTTVSLKLVLANTAQELERLAAKASGIDEVVGDMLVAGKGARPSVALLQDVDLLRQSVDCMQILIENLAREQICDCQVPADGAMQGIYLESIRKACVVAAAVAAAAE